MNAPTKMTAKQLTGYDRLHNALNKGTAFTEAERSAFCLEGSLLPAVLSLELQVVPPGPIACATTHGINGLVGHHLGWQAIAIVKHHLTPPLHTSICVQANNSGGCSICCATTWARRGR